MDYIKDKVKNLKERISEMYIQIGVKSEEFDLLLNQLKEIREEYTALAALPFFSEYLNVYTTTTQYIDIESKRSLINDASSIQEMSNYIENLKSDVESANEIIQSLLPLRASLEQSTLHVPEIQSRLEQLESRMSLVELKVTQFHEETCALVSNYADLVTRINELILNSKASLCVCANYTLSLYFNSDFQHPYLIHMRCFSDPIYRIRYVDKIKKEKRKISDARFELATSRV